MQAYRKKKYWFFYVAKHNVEQFHKHIASVDEFEQRVCADVIFFQYVEVSTTRHTYIKGILQFGLHKNEKEVEKWFVDILHVDISHIELGSHMGCDITKEIKNITRKYYACKQRDPTRGIYFNFGARRCGGYGTALINHQSDEGRAIIAELLKNKTITEIRKDREDLLINFADLLYYKQFYLDVKQYI